MKTKKVIAREGLVLLGIVILGLVIYFIARHLNSVYLIRHQEDKFRYVGNMKYSLVGYTPYLKTMSLGKTIALFGYPFIAVIRFILWSFKALKEK